MTFPRIHRLVAVWLGLTALFATGCSSTSTKPDRPPDFVQSEADDVAQMLGATIALDQGGWMLEIERALLKRRTEGDTTEVVTQGPLSHDFSYIYNVRAGGAGAVWDTSVVSVDVHDVGVGTFASVTLQGFHRHVSDISIFSADEDTMYFNTLASDSSRFTMKSFVRSDTVYYQLDNFFDYEELRLHKDQINPWPIDGAAAWLVDATKFTTASFTTATRNILVEATIAFDGTQTPFLFVFEDIGQPSSIFRYTVDLKTGAVTRAP